MERFAVLLLVSPPRFFFLPLSLALRAATLSRIDDIVRGDGVASRSVHKCKQSSVAYGRR